MKDKIKRRSIYGEKRPKTLKGMERKFWTGDGRKTAPRESYERDEETGRRATFWKKGETEEKEEIIGGKMFESLCDTVLGIVERWIPKKKYSKEIEYRDELMKFIRNELKRRQRDILFGIPEEHSVQKEAGRAHADIEIDVNKLYRRLAQSLL